MTRVALVSALIAATLTACKAPAPQHEAAASSAPASSAPAAPAQPPHHYAFQNGDEYGYVSSSHAQAGQNAEADKPVTVRYLGMQDGVYTIAEVEGGAVVVAQCAAPCQQVRIRGKDLDQTLDLSPNSIVYAALTDAMNGQLQVYKPRPR